MAIARLLLLSNELLQFILNFLDPRDLENFTYACKKLHEVASKHLEKHRVLKKQFGKVVTSDANPISAVCTGGTVHHWQLLKEVKLHPHKGCYVTELRVEYRYGYWDAEYDLFDRYLLTYDDYIMVEKENGVSDFTYEGSEDIDSWKASWRFLLFYGNENLIIAFLFMELPSLERLTLEVDCSDEGSFFEIFKWHAALPGSFLPHLESVTIRDLDHSDKWSLLSVFAALPSVKSLFGRYIGPTDGHARDEFSLKPRCSNVDELSLYKSHADSDTLSKLLHGIKSLKSFSYDLAGWVVEPDNFLAAHNALLMHAKTSLEVLSFRDSDYTQKHMLSFRKFSALRELSIDFVLLMGSKPSTKRKLPRNLPASVETVTLFECQIHSMHWFMSIMKTLLANKKKLVPKLKEMRFVNTVHLERLSGAVQEATASRAESAGFSLSVM